MPASDRPSESRTLDPATIEELRAALSRSAASGSHGEELNGLLVRAAAEARKNGLQAEQLVVMLKDIWHSLPNVATQPGSEVQTKLREQLVARSIREYYAP